MMSSILLWFVFHPCNGRSRTSNGDVFCWVLPDGWVSTSTRQQQQSAPPSCLASRFFAFFRTSARCLHEEGFPRFGGERSSRPISNFFQMKIRASPEQRVKAWAAAAENKHGREEAPPTAGCLRSFVASGWHCRKRCRADLFHGRLLFLPPSVGPRSDPIELGGCSRGDRSFTALLPRRDGK
ncbi:unnamed protein product [Scytosiphon promiscuus]